MALYTFLTLQVFLQMRCSGFAQVLWFPQVCDSHPYHHGCGGQCLVTVGELVLSGLAC